MPSASRTDGRMSSGTVFTDAYGIVSVPRNSLNKSSRPEKWLFRRGTVHDGIADSNESAFRLVI
jgi:hypothetical protein